MVCHIKYRSKTLLLYNLFHTLWKTTYLLPIPVALKIQSYDICRISNIKIYLLGIPLTIIADVAFHLAQLFIIYVKIK